jgi:hypothetical protein
MSPSEAQSAIYFLSRVAPRGINEEHELVRLIQSLTILANPSKKSYNGRSATAA